MPVHLYAPEQSPLEQIIDACKQRLHASTTTDALTTAERLTALHDVTILIPEQHYGAAIRHGLLEALGKDAGLLAPRVHSLQHFLTRRVAPAGRILNTHAQELMLIEVLQRTGHPWQMADELLRWFEALELTNQTPDYLSATLAQNGLDNFADDSRQLALLWQAWETQLDAETATTRNRLLREGLQQNTPTGPILMVGYDWLHSRELCWVERQLNAQQLTLWVRPDQPLYTQLQHCPVDTPQLPSSGVSARAKSLQVLFEAPENASLLTRSKKLDTAQLESYNTVTVFAAKGSEEEALAIERQARLWWLQGRRAIGIITEDRRLARRISALLHRAGIAVHDDAGWPLSTTAAAGVVERWLETVETDFDHSPLLDVLKSGFMGQASLDEESIFLLQRDIIEREQCASDLQRYRHALAAREQALDAATEPTYRGVWALLERIETAARPLAALIHCESIDPGVFLDALKSSLQTLGLWEGLIADPAGQRIEQETVDMQQALYGRALKFSWQECRMWLGRAFETHNFRPARLHSGIRILNLDQSRLADFDAIILAGADDHTLPTKPHPHIFFNDTARYALGLKTLADEQLIAFSRFRRLIECPVPLVITYTKTLNGETRQPSPWLDLLDTFLQAAGRSSLHSDSPGHLAQQTSAAVQSPWATTLPQPTTEARAHLPGTRLPRRLSAAAHQRLIECPYRFFASDGLRLKAREEVVEKLNKRDFGNIVHQALYLFHSGTQQQPAFPQALTTENRASALEHLVKLGQSLITEATVEGFERQAWQNSWQAVATALIDWEIRHAQQWHNLENEIQLEIPIPGLDVRLWGQIDRIDIATDGRQILDYKTGGFPKIVEIQAGEKVQLLTYALLDPQATEAGYLEINTNKKWIKRQTMLEADTIDELRKLSLRRLLTVLTKLQEGAPLPAHGHPDTACQFCQIRGLCRKQRDN